jgi:hypothetical protein
MKSICHSAMLLALWLVAASVQAEVRASVDSSQVRAGDTIQFTLSHDGQTGSKPDLAPLEQDFDVLATSRSSNVRIVNGSFSSQTQIQMTLSPKRSGPLTIPSLAWDNERSAPIRITVGSGGSAQSGTNQSQSGNVFLKAVVDDSQPYVQGAVNLTVQLYAAVPLYRATLDLPASSDVLVQQLGEDQKRETNIDGRPYEVIERHYLLFPQHSGTLHIPGPVLDAQVPVRARNDPFSDFFGRSPLADMMQDVRPIRVHAQDIALDVQPRPAAATASYWIPARKLDVTAQWHPDSLTAQAGEPVTLDLHLRAEGLTAAQLPDVASLIDLPPGLKAYPDQAKLENTAQNGTVVGERDQSVALIADRAGDFTIPALKIQWWDTGAAEFRQIELPSRMLHVTPGAGGVASTPAPANVPQAATAGNSTQNNSPESAVRRWPWHWVSLALAILWLATMVAWWLSRRRAPKIAAPAPTETPPLRVRESQARDRFQSACRINDPLAARRALLDWAQARWPDAPPAGLRALAGRLDDSEIDALLVDLDRACFAHGEWNGSALAQALKRLPVRHERKADAEELAELYR